MTGVVEATSLALAVVPIIISATKSFSTATCALKRYRHFSSEIGRLSTLVKLQRTIFHGEIKSLLAWCVGWDQAEQLLQDIDHAKWHDKDLEQSFVTRLRETRTSFLELVQWIDVELTEMEAKVGSFEEVAPPANTVGLFSPYMSILEG